MNNALTRNPATDSAAYRPIRSFVLREGRLTPAQALALERLWARYGIDAPDGSSGKLDMATLFGRDAPLAVEIGFGAGDALAAYAAAHPDHNLLGIEVHRPGVGRVMHRAEIAGIDHLRVARHDAVEVLRDWLPAGSVDTLMIYFPDPWHKKRHHKRRLVQPAFIDIVATAMRPGGILHMATDWAHYAEQMLATMRGSDQFENLAADAGYAERAAERPITRFEARGERLGHAVFDLAFRRR